MKVALAQINTTVGDIDGNSARIIDGVEKATTLGADLVVFPELGVFGYPPKDLLLRKTLVKSNVAAVHRIARHCTGTTAVVGYVQPNPNKDGTGLRNAAALCGDGRVLGSYAKMLLPTYDVFDEARYFTPGSDVCVEPVPCGGRSIRVGLTICEDLWNDHQFDGRRAYGVDPVEKTVEAGAELLVNIGASPFVAGKQAQREAIFAGQVREHDIGLVSVNLVGGNDDLVFDGGSFALNPSGSLVARAAAFAEDLLVVDLSLSDGELVSAYPNQTESIHRALVLGIRDYVGKCGFKEVVIGLSGGLDSATTAALAVEAIGADHVHGVALPSRYSSEHSVEDARRLAQNLGIELSMISIADVHRAFEAAVGPQFNRCSQSESGVAEENIQARIRGTLLMALSNKFGWLLLTTGNKSELAVGYCTLYGDMCGGLAVLSDVPKTAVYELARRINQSLDVPPIPQHTIDKEPSAELRENQRDQDTLPPYSILDPILEQYIEHDSSIDAITALGFDPEVVRRVVNMVDRNEYKRRQAPVGLKVTSRAFGTGRRMPIAAKPR